VLVESIKEKKSAMSKQSKSLMTIASKNYYDNYYHAVLSSIKDARMREEFNRIMAEMHKHEPYLFARFFCGNERLAREAWIELNNRI
jgi:hypothetical protein